jgi:23S rRNA (uracil1939-C5)-methyltransferase
MAHGGKAVARQDGRVVFVPFGIPGESVEVELYRTRRRYAEGEISRVLSPSPDRVEPECPYFGECGGCQLQHIAYPRQLELKRKVVADLLERVGGFRDISVHPTVGSPSHYGYRNSARFLGGRRGDLGYTDWRTNSFLRVDACPIMEPPISEELRRVQGRGRPGESLRVRYSEATGETLVWPPVGSPPPAREPAACYELLGASFQVSATSFFQVNTRQAENLIRLSLERLRPLEGRTVLDAYCGVGTFTRFIAAEAARTIGIEESPSAVADARVNLAGLGVRLVEGRTELELAAVGPDVDLVLLDPPRTGCEPQALDALLALAPEKVVYVSCDPATLARDLKALCSEGAYTLIDVQPVDMFPQTYHIEAIATLVQQ